ncbi:MAG: zinc-ribbon domain-containing protein [Planctomycetes bacterium]|nr:zinc-ribbon domain-containing protein [Planctomycetota bacterium]
MGPRGREPDDDYFICPHCGAEVAWDARVCPQCGSDELTGWAEDAGKWGAGIPTGYSKDDEFDYEDFIRREFGRDAAGGGGLAVWALAIALMALLLVVVLVIAL